MPTHSAPDNSPATVPVAREPERLATQSFANVARRVARRTTDLIAVSLVLIGSLTFGRQAVEWWRAAPEIIDPASLAGEPINSWITGVEIEFGDAPFSLSRWTIGGDREVAVTRLVAECRGIAESPTSLPLRTAAERELISRLGPLTPVAQAAGQWSIYRLEESFSLVAAIRPGTSPDGSDDPDKSRLLCFGMAVPEGESQWTLMLFRSAAGRRPDGMIPLADVIPQGYRRLLGLRSETGELLAGIAGRGGLEAWQAEFDSHLLARGWRRTHEWSRSDQSWSAEFRRDGNEDRGALRIVMTSAGNDDWTGLICQSPP